MPLSGPFVAVTPLVLASASPRRRVLLTDLGLDFAVRPSHVPEPLPVPGEFPPDYAMRVARLKARKAAIGGGRGLILGADTVVALPRLGADAATPLSRLDAGSPVRLPGVGGEAARAGDRSAGAIDRVDAPRDAEWRIMGKPADAAEAREMLAALSGRTHVVTTGCCLLEADGREHCFAVSARVTMRRSSPRELAAYAATGEPLDKAGAYAIQGRGAFLVSAIQGSVSAVIGLPVTEVLERLLALGAVRPAD